MTDVQLGDAVDGRDGLDVVAVDLCEVGATVLDNTITDEKLRQRTFLRVPEKRFQAAVAADQ